MISRAHSFAACAAAVLLIASVAPARSQGNFGAGRPSKAAHPQSTYSAAPPMVRNAPEPWPRLDPGAVFCNSADDLQQHAMAINAALDGKERALMTPGCSMLQVRTPVDVLDRSTLGRTQVRVRATGDIGWTDVWLPDRPPGG
jgi:hypothetical protein